MVVLRDFRGILHWNLGDIDVFAYGVTEYEQRFALDPSIPLYHRSCIDDCLTLDKELIYVHPDYQDTLDRIARFDFSVHLHSFLDVFCQYHQQRLNESEPLKSHYQIIRLRGMLAHWEATGLFEQVVSEPWRSQLIAYKLEWNTAQGKAAIPWIREALAEINQIKERIKTNELG